MDIFIQHCQSKQYNKENKTLMICNYEQEKAIFISFLFKIKVFLNGAKQSRSRRKRGLLTTIRRRSRQSKRCTERNPLRGAPKNTSQNLIFMSL